MQNEAQDRSADVAKFIYKEASGCLVDPAINYKFVTAFPQCTVNELYAGYEHAHELAEGEPAFDRIDHVFDHLVGEGEDALLNDLAASLEFTKE